MKKKNICLFLAESYIAFTCVCFAQDVIVTKDARKIDAEVTEVNSDNIKYKTFDNLDGPTYTLPKSDLLTILYQNGKVETFETESSRNQPTTSVPAQTQQTQTNTSVPVQTQNQRTIQPDLNNRSLAFLKGQEKLHVVFDYDNFMIDGIPEKDYFTMRGQKEVEQWEEAKNTTFKTAFLTHLNRNINAGRMRLLCGDYPDAPYQAIIRVLKNTAGRKKGVTCEMIFIQKSDNIPLAKMTFSGKSRRIGGLFGAQVGGISYLTGTAFGYAGENLGKSMVRKIR